MTNSNSVHPNTFHWPRWVLAISIIPLCWLGMMLVHELGHVLGAWLTGGTVERVVFHPLKISRTDVSSNPHPLIVVWSGPLFGVLAPVLIWLVVRTMHPAAAFVARTFLGFCLLANGLYLGIGSFDRVGDAGELLRTGAAPWQLWLFGMVCSMLGLWSWDHLKEHFGFGTKAKSVQPAVAIATLVIAIILLLIAIILLLIGVLTPT